MEIKTISVKNYRSFKDSRELKISKLFALIGKNNSGKSALIDAIQVLWGNKSISRHDFHQGCAEDIEIAADVGNFQSRDSVEGLVDEKGRIRVTLRCKKDELKPTWYFNDDKKAKTKKSLSTILPELLVIPAVRNPENETTAGTRSFLKQLIEKILQLKQITAPKLSEIKTIPAEKLDISQIKTLLEYRTKEQVSNIALKTTDYFREATGDETLSIDIDPTGDLSKAMSYVTNLVDPCLGKALEKVDILNCGTGLQSMIILSLLQSYADVEGQDDALMLIEEPEVYLHPGLQRRMFQVLRKIAKGTQVVYTTHSPIMISELWANESVRLVTKEASQTSINVIDIQNVINELGIRYDDVLNPKVVVFVEGLMDIDFYRFVVSKLYPEYGDDERRIKFIPSDGYQNINAFALMTLLYSANVKTPFYIIADSDGYLPDKRTNYLCESIAKKVPAVRANPKELGDKIKILSDYAIESLFLDYGVIKNLVPKLTRKEYDEFIVVYNNKYSEVLSKFRASEKDEDRKALQIYLKPKLIFELPKKRRDKYSEFYDNNKSYLEVRDKIENAWCALKRSGNNPISVLFKGMDLEKMPHISEPLRFIKEVIEATQDETVKAKC